MMPVLKILHQDSFPYGGYNKVRFIIGDSDVTLHVSRLLIAFWESVDPTMGEWFYCPERNCFVIRTGESFGEEDFAECVRDLFKIEVVAVLYAD